MNIQNNSRLHDFEIFEGCFGKTRIMPTDIDGCVERGGNFLLIEYKPGNKSLTIGQRITLETIACNPLYTVIVVWHIPSELHEHKNVTHMQILPFGKKISITENDLRSFVNLWFINSTKTHFNLNIHKKQLKIKQNNFNLEKKKLFNNFGMNID